VDAGSLVEQLGGLRAHARNVHQLDHAGRHPALGRLDLLHLAGVEVLDDLAGQIPADAGQRIEPPLVRHRLDVLAERFDGLGGAAIGADAKRVLAAQLEHVGHELEQPCDFEVLHRPFPPLFCIL
jgi:hypothetical protein